MSEHTLSVTMVESVPRQRRIETLSRVPALAPLGPRALAALASTMTEEHIRAGEVVVAEGEVSTDLYLVVEGRAEVTTARAGGQVILAHAGPGEMFGELAIFDAERRRQATVTAQTPMVLLCLSASAFAEVLRQHPDIRDHLEAAREQLLLTRFLKASSPFASVDHQLVRKMTAFLRYVHAPQGSVIVRQGDEGETCYLVRSGRVQVVVRDDLEGERPGAEREVATLTSGMLFGEASLLTGDRRNATVRALDDCDLLEMRRSDLVAALGTSAELRCQVVELMRLRDRPIAVAGIIAQERTSATGETIVTLKNPSAGTYYRLSPQGYFIWQRLDGKHNLRDLALEYLVAFKSFAPQVIAELIAGMRAAGFIESGVRLTTDLVLDEARPVWQRTFSWMRRTLEWQVAIPRIDDALGWLYDRGLCVLFTRWGQVFLALLSLTGILAFSLLTMRDGTQFAQVRFGGWLLLGFGAAYLFSVLIHEMGHGLAVKAFGHEVVAGGVGWFWLGPTAFVDTSDLWMADRWPRIATSLAGPYANLILGSAAALVALGHGYGIAQAALWQFALTSYTLAIFNLNPLIEYDGYFVLLDLVGTPNLKRRSLRWLGSMLAAPRSIFAPGALRAHRFDLLYGLGAVAYTLAMTVLIVASYRLVLQGWVALVIPAGVAEILAWVLAVAVIAIAIADIVGGMRGVEAVAS